MANTYTLLGSYAATGNVSSIVFSSISSSYTDLLIKCSLRTNDTGNNYTDIDITFNGETARKWLAMYSVTTSVGSSTSTGFNIAAEATGTLATSNIFSNSEIYIPNYNSGGVKTLAIEATAENNSTTNWNLQMGGNTVTNGGSAINSITLFPFGSFSFVQYSTAYLYGIKNA